MASRAPVTLADLRNPELDRIDVARDRLVDIDPLHYACTREWASVIAAGGSGASSVEGCCGTRAKPIYKPAATKTGCWATCSPTAQPRSR